jgi:hypothetical protein
MGEATVIGERSGEVVVYEGPDGGPRVEVVVQDETVWLTSRQMSELFQTTTRNVEIHARNAYQEGELEEGATAKESFVVRSEGGREVRRRIRHYSLDVIISVGYRVKSLGPQPAGRGSSLDVPRADWRRSPASARTRRSARIISTRRATSRERHDDEEG